MNEAVSSGGWMCQVDAALRAFAERNGRNWKSDLRLAWSNGNYRKFGCSMDEASVLQSVRNHPDLNFTYLEKFKP